MKKLIPFITLAIVILIGCAKEEKTTIDAKNQIVEEPGAAWVMNNDNDNPSWEVVALDELSFNSTDTPSKRSNSAHTHGEFAGFGGVVSITFNGTENNGGPHGSAEILQAFGPFTVHYAMETICVSVDGNEAIYGGVITEVFENNFPQPPPPPGCPGLPYCPTCNPNDVGNSVYFKVIDNGQGSGASADQYYGNVIQLCSPSTNCLATFPWSIFGINDVEEGEQIKVNN